MQNREQHWFEKTGLAILATGLVAGTLDALGAIVHFLITGGKNPEIIFKYIASGVFGKQAYSSGAPMIVAGLFFHYAIALIFTAIFFWLAAEIKWIRENALLSGVIYGVIVWTVMSQVVIPLSHIKPAAFNLTKAAIAACIIVVCVGLPVALLAKKHYLYKK